MSMIPKSMTGTNQTTDAVIQKTPTPAPLLGSFLEDAHDLWKKGAASGDTHLDRVRNRMLEIGIISDDQAKEIQLAVKNNLGTLGIEPLVAKSIRLFANDPLKTSHAEITFFDDEVSPWTRRSLAAFLNPASQNPIPTQAIEIMTKLQHAGLPVGASLEVWVPETPSPTKVSAPMAKNTSASAWERSALKKDDPILVVSFSDRFVFLLCRWSNNVG